MRSPRQVLSFLLRYFETATRQKSSRLASVYISYFLIRFLLPRKNSPGCLGKGEYIENQELLCFQASPWYFYPFDHSFDHFIRGISFHFFFRRQNNSVPQNMWHHTDDIFRQHKVAAINGCYSFGSFQNGK